MSARTKKPNNWRIHLHRLEPLNLPLLPCGAGPEKKGPIDVETGRGLTGWPSARFTVPEILAMNGVVRSVGTRTGDGCLCFDIDGGTAIDLALEHGCDPQEAHTWQVHRTTDPLRLKVLFSLTPEQQQQLGKVITSALTLEAPRDSEGKAIGKGEALELFHSPGKQVILLGEHPKSGGQYIWPDGNGPEALAPIPDCWWQLALKIAAGELGITPTPAARPLRKASSSTGWKPINPCPICGRNTTSWCTSRPDNGSINCRHGSTFSPVLAHGVLKVGQTITGTNGVVYGYCGDAVQTNGDTFSSFVVHSPRQQQQQEPRKAAPASAQASAPGTLPASFEQLIHNLPDGWVETEHGPRPSKIRVGEMARLIKGKAGELLRFNEMTMYVEANTSAGWLKVDDAGMDAAYVLLDQKGWIIGLESVIKAICHVARQRTIHPVRQYLDRVAADPTIEPLALTALVGQFLRPDDRPDDPAGMLYGRMLAKTIVGAVARAMKPGCKVDTCCTLVGEQGAKKSTFWEALAGTAFYSSSSLGNLEKDALLLVHSVWFLEAAELECITGKKAAGEIKAFLSTKVDHFRRPYNRSIDGYERPSIVVGTSNRDDFLVDTTGSRRFWIIPVTATKIDVEGVRAIRDRIWKAAVIAYRQGQRWWLDQADETASEEENKLFAASHPWEGPISDWLNSQKPKQFTSAEALVQAGLRKADQIQKRDEMAMATVLTGLRWVQCRVQEGGTRTRVWRPS